MQVGELASAAWFKFRAGRARNAGEDAVLTPEIVNLIKTDATRRYNIARTSSGMLRYGNFLDRVSGLEAGVDANAVIDGTHTALTWASAVGSVEIVKALLAIKGIDVNAKSAHQGMTALLMASMYGHVEVMRLLLATKDVNVDATDVNGWTALQLAKGMKHHEAEQCLLNYQKRRRRLKAATIALTKRGIHIPQEVMHLVKADLHGRPAPAVEQARRS